MSDFVAVHTLENLQTVILLGVFLVCLIQPSRFAGADSTLLQNNHDRADAAWSMLGASIKVD